MHRSPNQDKPESNNECIDQGTRLTEIVKREILLMNCLEYFREPIGITANKEDSYVTIHSGSALTYPRKMSRLATMPISFPSVLSMTGTRIT